MAGRLTLPVLSADQDLISTRLEIIAFHHTHFFLEQLKNRFVMLSKTFLLSWKPGNIFLKRKENWKIGFKIYFYIKKLIN